jgi:hypothetical protein
MTSNHQQHDPLLRVVTTMIVNIMLPILYAGAWVSSLVTVASMLGIICFDVPLAARISLYFWVKALLVDHLMRLAKVGS